MVGGQELILPICGLDEKMFPLRNLLMMAGAKYQMQPIVCSGSFIPIGRQL